MIPDQQIHTVVSLENLSIGYEAGDPLLNSINLSVARGEMVALIGRNGTGKSTLLKSMIGLVPLLKGSCFLNNEQLRSYDLRNRARLVSFVSAQVSQLPSITVSELVALGRMPYTGWMGRLGKRDRELVLEALAEVGMSTYADRKLDKLSDGERQRVMIARAFVQDTPLMVLDEPSAFLDIPNKYELIRLLTGFRNGGKSIVYSTHDLETAMMCADKLWVIHMGEILEGSPEDLGISGIFDTLFETTGITFDETSRRFRYMVSPRGQLQLVGAQGNLLMWTKSALERLGFQVDKEATTILRVENTSQGPQLVLSGIGEPIAFQNIYSLARFLLKDK